MLLSGTALRDASRFCSRSASFNGRSWVMSVNPFCISPTLLNVGGYSLIVVVGSKVYEVVSFHLGMAETLVEDGLW